MSPELHHAITFVLVWINIGCMTWFVEATMGRWRFYSVPCQVVMGMFTIAWWPLALWEISKGKGRAL